jgi:hypothetical protein
MLRARRPVLRLIRWRSLEEQHYMAGFLDRRRGEPSRADQALGCNEAAYLDGYRDGQRVYPRVPRPRVSPALESIALLQKEAA